MNLKKELERSEEVKDIESLVRGGFITETLKHQGETGGDLEGGVRRTSVCPHLVLPSIYFYFPAWAQHYHSR